jgi:hypothetical protein
MANTEQREDPRDGIVKPFQCARQKCNDCGKAIKPIFKASKDPEDWFWLECDTCEEPFCKDCCEVDDNSGKVECFLCYQGRVIRTGK